MLTTPKAKQTNTKTRKLADFSTPFSGSPDNLKKQKLIQCPTQSDDDKLVQSKQAQCITLVKIIFNSNNEIEKFRNIITLETILTEHAENAAKDKLIHDLKLKCQIKANQPQTLNNRGGKLSMVLSKNVTTANVIQNKNDN
eukprot:5965_1